MLKVDLHQHFSDHSEYKISGNCSSQEFEVRSIVVGTLNIKKNWKVLRKPYCGFTFAKPSKWL